jgi:hypothetical protein
MGRFSRATMKGLEAQALKLKLWAIESPAARLDATTRYIYINM